MGLAATSGRTSICRVWERRQGRLVGSRRGSSLGGDVYKVCDVAYALAVSSWWSEYLQEPADSSAEPQGAYIHHIIQNVVEMRVDRLAAEGYYGYITSRLGEVQKCCC